MRVASHRLALNLRGPSITLPLCRVPLTSDAAGHPASSSAQVSRSCPWPPAHASSRPTGDAVLGPEGSGHAVAPWCFGRQEGGRNTNPAL